MDKFILSVSQLNCYIKSLIDEDINLNCVFLKGEISNFTNHYRSGHLYFSIKDENSVIKAIMFSSFANRLKFKLENGMNVIVRGRVSVYEATGQYQFYVEDIQPDGIGALNLAFEQLKLKLQKEGLFDVKNKKPLSKYPSKIGVITSDTGAAISDIQQILSRRYAIAELILAPVLVQGDSAPKQIIDAINKFNILNAADVIIVGRGGGSIEDLWAFNDEGVARAIASSNIPIISAVGHETDFTICDFVADLRASTPSAAAELVALNKDDIFININFLYDSMLCSMKNKINAYKSKIDVFMKCRELNSPISIIENRSINLDLNVKRLNNIFSSILLNKKEEFIELNSKLDILNPLRIMSSGYNVASSKNTSKLIKSKKDVKINEEIILNFIDGEVDCIVKEVR